MEIWANTRATEIVGDSVVRGIKVQRNGKGMLLLVQGVFIEIVALQLIFRGTRLSRIFASSDDC